MTTKDLVVMQAVRPMYPSVPIPTKLPGPSFHYRGCVLPYELEYCETVKRSDRTPLWSRTELYPLFTVRGEHYVIAQYSKLTHFNANV